MGAINTIPQVAMPAMPKVSAPSVSVRADNATPAPVIKVGSGETLDQQRFEAVKRASGNIANATILGTSSFALFKDSTGQYITRITDRNSGKVTYIPEPQLMKTSAPAPSVVDIKA